MVNPEHFELSKEELKERLNWYSKKYGPYIRNRGVHNWKNLFLKPNIYDWTILFMIIMALFIAWSYQHDIAICREYVEYQQKTFVPMNPPEILPNLTYINITVKEDFLESGEG